MEKHGSVKEVDSLELPGFRQSLNLFTAEGREHFLWHFKIYRSVHWLVLLKDVLLDTIRVKRGFIDWQRG